MEEECVDGGGDAVLQLHLPCNPLFSCTVSVGTDLSMADISDLHAEVCELRKTVRHLEERLSQALNLSNQVCGHDATLAHCGFSCLVGCVVLLTYIIGLNELGV